MRAIFLDKDGTLIEDVPYNVDPALITLSWQAGPALHLLQLAAQLGGRGLPTRGVLGHGLLHHPAHGVGDASGAPGVAGGVSPRRRGTGCWACCSCSGPA